MPAKSLTPLLALVLGFAILVTLFPIFWIVMTALKPPTDWNAVPAIWIPAKPTMVNFRTLFDPDAIREYGVGGVSQSATAAGTRLAVTASSSAGPTVTVRVTGSISRT